MAEDSWKRVNRNDWSYLWSDNFWENFWYVLMWVGIANFFGGMIGLLIQEGLREVNTDGTWVMYMTLGGLAAILAGGYKGFTKKSEVG